MSTHRLLDFIRYGLMLLLLCAANLPQSASAVLTPPTGPRTYGANTVPDYYTTANWANSPPIAKFVDTLPGLTAANANNLGQYLPVAVPDTTTYPGSDYYIIELREYSERMHSDLNPTKLRGYVQVDSAGVPVAPIHYLGPVIVAERDRPVRLKFVNKLPTGAGGNLFIPVDTTVMGAGTGPATAAGTPCDNTPFGNPNGCASYTQNRADIHLHGGRTPWISDGTPHQWITPAGEITPFKQGVSLQNVPDMPDPGPGASTYYFTNQQSARLMFYHDHAFGITRLNVYAGEAAGYLITDKWEQDLVSRGIIPANQIPLIIQDKTFVDATPTVKHIYNPATGKFDTPITVPKVRETDPLWNWGSGSVDAQGVRAPVTGDLWLPHVYMPAQTSTAGIGGVNPFGRWMYGPWFFPATVVTQGPVANPYFDPNCSSSNPILLAQCQTPGQPMQIPGTPNVSMGMEAFQDSAVVNGTAFPTLTVDPKAYRFRILNAASDRFQNLSFYVADPDQVSPDTRPASRLTEVKTVPASASLAAANNWPALWPTDGREGGVPDPAFRGPSFLQIGTEGGFLPQPVVREPQPITYVTDPTAFWWGIVLDTGLALGPAERADVIVDFSAYAGKTLILYNDAPAAWPARVPGYDYFTGAPDRRDSGGYGTGGTWDPITGSWVGGTGTLPGFAPNTRTVMQVIVTNNNPTSYDPAPLYAEFNAGAPATAVNPADPVTGNTKTLFERAQEPIVVGQAAYSGAYPNSYFPTNFPWEGISQINDHFLQFVTLAGEEVRVPMHPKGIHDEMGASFDPIYGRMSGNLGMQVPNPTTLTALLVLYGYSDLPTEVVTSSTSLNVTVGQVITDPYLGNIVTDPLANNGPSTTNLADGTQIWNISHNGVDTHPIHFHIFDVQLINRVGWDGQIAMPEPNELGWKDTIKISPLMNTIVAVRPRAPALPFGIPDSIRPLNPAIPIDSTMGFTPVPTNGSAWPEFNSVDWRTGGVYVFNPGPPPFPYDNYKGVVTNVMQNMGWEYVWHCHILSHEEMDMMRTIVLKVDTAAPPAFSAKAKKIATDVQVTWDDPTPVKYTTTPTSTIAADPETYRNPANEIGFNVYRSTDGVNFTKRNNALLLANSTSYSDIGAAGGNYLYQVEAVSAKGSTYSGVTNSAFTVTVANPGVQTAPATFTLTANIAGLPATMSIVKVDFYSGTELIGTSSTAGGPYTMSWSGVMGGTYSITARATDSLGGVTSSAVRTVTVNSSFTADFTAIGTVSGAGKNPGFCEGITFTASPNNINTYSYQWGINGTYPVTPVTSTVAGALPIGVYPVYLQVTDTSTGESSTVIKNVSIVNHDPVAITGGPYTVNPGGTVMLNASATDLLDAACNQANSMSFAWNIDNKGLYDYFTADPTIDYVTLRNLLGFGTHTITLKVTDVDGGIGLATTQLTVTANNTPESITVPASSTNGAFIVSWSPSGTAGATYTVEEATNAGFTAGNRIAASGILATQVDITGKSNGTYFYRVKVDAPTVSPWIAGANGCAVVLGTPTTSLPAFSPTLLTRDSQSLWENIIPNALADYFTYVPYTTADAVRLGFPSTCGNVAKGDVNSTEDCYTITVKKFAQPLAVQGIFGGGPGLRGTNGAALTADVYGYGSGGRNWIPPYIDTTKPGVTAGTSVVGNAPAPFVDGTLGTTGIWHFPAPTIKGTKGRPVRVQWLNELPNEAPTGLDPSVDCGPNAPYCFPYNRIVTHVHGAHVGPESDGLASAWFTPGFATKGEDFASTRQFGPEGTYYYPMDQEASTIWYHDHAMGTTHNNTNMGMAGFFPITDPVEQALKTCSGLNCKPVLPTGAYELGFALQDRHFTTAGKFAMPDYPIYDLTTPGCVPDQVTGLANDTNCPGGLVKWMKAADGHFIPYVPGDPLLSNPINATAPFGATSATLEYFGNMPVVNGVVYGKYNVEPRVYRMRFIGGTDSRTWVMKLRRADNNAVIPFWVIGSEQGLLNNPVQRPEMDLMPGERLDVLVDFTGVPAGTRIIMDNLGDDAPWAGYYDYLAQQPNYPRSVLIPEIMAFDVVPLVGIDNIKTPSASTVLRPGAAAVPAPPAADKTRVVSLMEITDTYGRTMPTIDARGFKPVGIPTTEIIRLNDVEQWDIVNTTVDAHPMHLHQVAFQVVNRQALTTDAQGNVTGFTPPVDDVVNQYFSQPQYSVTGSPISPDLWDAGWKDTIAAPPGYVTRVRAKFDITGDYVWHCHILSHEEHDMMRPFTVVPLSGGKGVAPAPASISVPSTSVDGNYTVSWVGTAIPGVTYELQEAANAAFTGATSIYTGAAPRFDVTGKTSGTTFYYRVRTVLPLSDPQFVTSVWRTGTNGVATSFAVLNVTANPRQGVVSTLSVTLPPAAPGATVNKVEYFNGASLLGQGAGAPAYQFSWTPASSGMHSLTAVVTYDLNTNPPSTEISTSAVVPVIVSPNTLVLTLVNPANNVNIDPGTPVTVTASIVPGNLPANTFVTLVEFFDGANLIGYDFTPTASGSDNLYSIAWTPLNSGTTSNLSAVAHFNNAPSEMSNVNIVNINLVTFSVNFTTSGNGTLIGPASQTVKYGQPAAIVTAVPATGHQFTNWTGNNGFATTTVNPLQVNNVTISQNITANFAIKTYTVTTSAGANGTITPTTTVNYNTSPAVTVTPVTGYHITDVTVDGVVQTVFADPKSFTVTFAGISADHTVNANFAIDTFTISTSAGANGSITAPATVNYGGNSPVITVTANLGYHILQLLVDGVAQTPADPKTFSTSFTNVTANHSVVASFIIDTFTITTSAGPNGSITPTATVDYAASSPAITVTPATGYHILQVLVDGTPAVITDPKTFTTSFTNVTANHTVSASFSIDTFTVATTAGANGSITAPAVVNYGSDSPAITVTPATGYHILQVLVDGTPAVIADPKTFSITFNGVTANHTVDATFTIDTFTVTTTAGANGSITPTATVNYGTSPVVAVTPATGYHIVTVLLDGAPVTITDPKTLNVVLTNISANHTIDATFAIDTFTITTTGGANGSITPTATVDYGTSPVVTVTPAANYHILQVLVDGAVQIIPDPKAFSYTFINTAANHNVNATFTIDTFAVTTTAGANGSITPTATINYGAPQTVIVTPAANYHILQVLVDGVAQSVLDPKTFIYPFNSVTAAHSVSATFTIDTYTVTTTAGANGSITPTVAVPFGGSQTITVTPAANYHIQQVLVDGVAQTITNPKTFSTSFTNVTATHTVDATFTIDTFTVNFASGVNGTLTGTTSQTVNYGAAATSVSAAPAAGYVFVNWTGTGGFVTTTANPLTVTNVRANLNITANFASIAPTAVRIGTTNYATLQEAYNAANTGDIIMIAAGTQVGTILANRPVTVTVSGGWNAGFTTNTGFTTIHSTFAVSNGLVRMQNINIID